MKKMIIALIVCSFACTLTVYSMDNHKKTKVAVTKANKRKNIKKKESNAKRRKMTPDSEQNPYGDYEFISSVCQHCGTEWSAQIDECPGCGNPTGFGDGYDVINHRYFVPKK